MIHVCYGLRDESGRYSKYVGTSIQSVLDNTQEEVTMHIIHDSTLSDENRRKLTIIAYQHNQEIRFYNVEELMPAEIEFIKQKLPRAERFWGTCAALYRTLIPDILDGERAIYLDSDTIVNRIDISELWQIDLAKNPIAAVPEMFSGRISQPEEEVRVNFSPCRENLVKPRDYFNSGVLLMDLNQVRKLGGGGHIFYSSAA